MSPLPPIRTHRGDGGALAPSGNVSSIWHLSNPFANTPAIPYTLAMPDDAWDFEHAERRPGAQAARAVVSVAFVRSDFERVSACAAHSNQRISAFIREAVLAKVATSPSHAALVGFTASAGATLFLPTPASPTHLSGLAVQLREVAVTT